MGGRAPKDIDERLAALCCPCGATADTVHLVDPSFDGLAPWPTGSDEGRPHTGPRKRGSLAVPCCPDHDLGPIFVRISDLRESWGFWLEHFGGKVWRGDRALLVLVDASR